MVLEEKDASNYFGKVAGEKLSGLSKEFLLAAETWNPGSSTVLHTTLSILEPGIKITGSNAEKLSFWGVNRAGQLIMVRLYPRTDQSNDCPLFSIAKNGQVKTYECAYCQESKQFHLGLFAAAFSLNGSNIYRGCQGIRYFVSVKKDGYVLDVTISKRFSSCFLKSNKKVCERIRTLFNEESFLESLTCLETPFEGAEAYKIIRDYFASLSLVSPLLVDELLEKVEIRMSRVNDDKPTIPVQNIVVKEGSITKYEAIRVVDGNPIKFYLVSGNIIACQNLSADVGPSFDAPRALANETEKINKYILTPSKE